MKRFTQCIFAFVLVLVSNVGNAQVTTSNIGGVVKSTSGELLNGASVKAIHVPTGTVSNAKTAGNGRFIINNVQAGGPYRIEISYIGYNPVTIDDIFVNLGETEKVDFDLAPIPKELNEVIVSTSRRSAPIGKGSVETNISQDRMANLPTVGRNLTDFIRLTPQAKTTAQGGISIAGQNNRYNQIMFDGAVNNDVFGLSETGTNGGQTGSSPISIDAIESFQVGVSPYDVALGNFTGGTINAITKSGTNKFKGSAYWINRNENLSGKTPTGPKEKAIKLPDFQGNIFGVTLGGPIIKNKLFFFISGEFQRDERPQPFDASTFRTPPGQAFQDSVNLIYKKLESYGYNAGDYVNIPDLLNSEKLAAKLTWNLNSVHRLNLSYRYTQSDRSNTSVSTGTRINFFNNGYLFPSTTHSASAELLSRSSNKISNKLLLTYTNVLDDRDPLGDAFPRVQLNSVNGTSYVFGTENFSTGNQLKQNNIALFDEFLYTAGNHQLKLGIDMEYSKSYNLFIRDNFGTYTYNFVNDWLQDLRPSAYARSYSLLDDKTGDGSAAGTEFNTLRMGFFAGDQWNISSTFSLNFGLRLDNFEFLTTPNEDTFFNKNAIPVISQFWDMQGARSGQRPEAQLSLSPRIGFTYDVEPGLKIRGGIGAFTGRVPLVWPGGVYNNTGVNVGGYTVNNPNITFRADPFKQYEPSDVGLSVNPPSGQIDLIAKDFKLPKVLKASIGLDKKIGKGWTWKADLLIQKTINEIVYYNLNAAPASKNALNQDVYLAINGTSTSYSRFDYNPSVAGTQNPYSPGIFLIANSEDNNGYTYNFTTSIDKSFSKGFAFNFTYSYGDAYTLFDGTSSQNNSQWRFMETKNGRNNITRSRSDFAQLHRFNTYVSKKFSYFQNKLASTITLFYNGQSGTPYSYVYSRSMIYDQNGGNQETSDLIYIPKDQADWARFAESYTSGGVTYSVAQQWTALDQFIRGDKHLNSRRGEFADRNGAVLPWSNIVDLKVQQDFVLGKGDFKHTFSVIFDMFNFTNFLNRNWGRVYVTPGFDAFSLISMEGYRVTGNTLTPRLTYRNITNTPAEDVLDVRAGFYNSSRWRGQLTLRYTF